MVDPEKHGVIEHFTSTVGSGFYMPGHCNGSQFAEHRNGCLSTPLPKLGMHTHDTVTCLYLQWFI
jgi:hypothetical protein